MAKRTIVIFGATGKQGGSVVKSVLADSNAASQFHVKAVTRDPTKGSAKSLADLGAEVVAGDLDNKESLHSIIKGAYGVFAVTNYWEKLSGEIEEAQGRAIADVCKAEGVKHLVWSSLLNVDKLSKGVLPAVYHFDSKARVEDYIRSIGIPASFFLAGFFMANIPGGSLRQTPDGKWDLSLPIPDDSPIPLFDAEHDAGKFVKAMFLNEDKVLGKRVYGATAYYTPAQLVEEFKELFPSDAKDAGYTQITHDVFKGAMASTGAPEVIQEEMLQNMRLLSEFGYYGGDTLDFSLGLLSENPTTWKEFAKNVPAFANLK